MLPFCPEGTFVKAFSGLVLSARVDHIPAFDTLISSREFVVDAIPKLLDRVWLHDNELWSDLCSFDPNLFMSNSSISLFSCAGNGVARQL